MLVKEILYGKTFLKQLKKLPLEIQKKAVKAENLFVNDAFHPSLRLHKLSGRLKKYWSISVDSSYRIIFYANGDGVFVYISIGKHSIYEE